MRLLPIVSSIDVAQDLSVDEAKRMIDFDYILFRLFYLMLKESSFLKNSLLLFICYFYYLLR